MARKKSTQKNSGPKHAKGSKPPVERAVAEEPVVNEEPIMVEEPAAAEEPVMVTVVV